MINAKKLVLPSAISCIVAGMAMPGFAQEATEEQAGTLEEIVVTGIRKSLTDSLAIKRNSSSIVEAISPEDIGKLPDTSIAESLARLPGLAGERVGGRTSGISVRGFNEEFVATTLNGRELLGIGDNRGVEFDLYPTEFLTGAVVYKTSDASLIHQGLGGTIDLQTRRPLDSERVLAVNGSFDWNDQESDNPDFDDQGFRLAFNYSDKFMDDTLGVALTLATMETPTQERQSAPWGFDDIDIPANSGIEGADPAGETVKTLGGSKPFTKSAELERDAISGTLQWEPTNRLSITADALYIDFLDSKVKRGIEEGARWGDEHEITKVEDGLATEGTLGFHSVVRNDFNTKDAELMNFGINADYRLNDNWTLGLDAAYSESEKELTDIESYSGVGRAGSAEQGPKTRRSYVIGEGDAGIQFTDIDVPDFTDPDVVRLAGPQAWGGGIGQFTNGLNNGQDGFVNNPTFDEDLTTLRADLEGHIDFSVFNRVELGVNYSDRSKSKDNDGFFLTAPGFNADLVTQDSDGDGVPDLTFDEARAAQTSVPVPEDFIVGTASLDFLGLGSILAYDGLGLFESGFYDTLDASEFQTDRLGDTYTVSEELVHIYAMTDFETGKLSGNIGIQAVYADQKSTGFGVTQQEIDGRVEVVATPISGGDNYWDILPSLNTTYELTENQLVRFGVSKTQTRSRMDDMKVNNEVTFNSGQGRPESDDPTFSAWSGSAGNPELKPKESVNVDLSYEWFYADDGHFAISVYHKELDNWDNDVQTLTDFTPFFIDGFHNGPQFVDDPDDFASFEGFTSTVGAGGEGELDGLEIQGSFPFRLLSKHLEGLGVIASATFLDGELETPVGDTGETIKSEIPGLSEQSYKLTVFYEKNGFEIRVSGRDREEFLTEGRGISLSLEDETDAGSTLWDAQIGYDFGAAGFSSLEGLRITLQGQNLTEEETVKIENDDPRQVREFQSFGRTFQLGVNYSF